MIICGEYRAKNTERSFQDPAVVFTSCALSFHSLEICTAFLLNTLLFKSSYASETLSYCFSPKYMCICEGAVSDSPRPLAFSSRTLALQSLAICYLFSTLLPSYLLFQSPFCFRPSKLPTASHTVQRSLELVKETEI